MLRIYLSVLLFAVTGFSLAQTTCSYFSNANNCAPAAVTGTESTAKPATRQNANSQPIPVQQQSSFTQQNSNSSQDWNTQQKLYTPLNMNSQQNNTTPQKSAAPQAAAPTINSRQNAESILTTNGNGQAVTPNTISNGAGTNIGILNSSQQNLTSTTTNSLSTGARNSLSNGSSLKPITTSPNSLSSASAARVHAKSYDDESSGATQKGVNTRSVSTTLKSKKTSETKPKDATNCIFVGMQQVCG
jgi:hypothetical protein